MTPFMVKVVEVAGGERADRVQLRPSEPMPTVVGADEQVMARALAEQLVSEANAVLGGAVELRDELVAGRLSFELRYKQRRALVSTTFGGGTSVARLDDKDVALDSPEQVEALLLQLLEEPFPSAERGPL
ncbi:MAG: hypothetical protein ACTHMS_03630 [Jatrophihabitans sp.]|uniref:hypothetical protein n=1 Tax=Jatrophihabitans sp. TaxID=1932789 RepID=UPI003F81B367